MVAKTSVLIEVLASDWRKAARFFASFGIAEQEFLAGNPSINFENDGYPFSISGVLDSSAVFGLLRRWL